MQSNYNDTHAQTLTSDLDLRVYTSRLLGEESSLVLHGGGNTSVKSKVTNLFGEEEAILYVKGSGWDLATIEAAGFAPVKMDILLKMAQLEELSDTNMVKYQRAAMIDPSAPNPSVEAILHAIIPFKYVDHTHADAIVTITNTDNSKARVEEIFGKNMLIIPYIMPGFVLAQLVYKMTKDIDWHSLDGMILMNHGLFTFSDDAKISYEKTIALVTQAETHLKNQKATLELNATVPEVDTLQLAKLRQEISSIKSHPSIVKLNQSAIATHFAQSDIERISQQGPLTPDHVIRTKRIPAIVEKDFSRELRSFQESYEEYFSANATTQTSLNSAPNFAIYKDIGALSFGKNAKEAGIIEDITEHTFEAILKAEKLGGYKALSAAEIFEVEYWELEQAKLKKSSSTPALSGKIALIMENSSLFTACANELRNLGCEVVMLSNDANINELIRTTILNFGGIDIVIGSHVTLSEERMSLLSPYLAYAIDKRIIAIESSEAFTCKEATHTLHVKNDKVVEKVVALVCSSELKELSLTSLKQ